MSIIYDALKKIENSIDKTPQVKEKNPKSKRRVYFFLFILIACLGFIAAGKFFNFATKFSSQSGLLAPSVKTPVLDTRASSSSAPVLLTDKQKTAPEASISIPVNKREEKLREAFVLSGVFFSQDKGYALINNRVVEEGDTIEGTTVLRINLDGVELKNQAGLSIHLSASNK